MCKDKNCRWTFSIKDAYQRDKGGGAPEFQVLRSDVETMVREAIQNSVDARKDVTKPVLVSFNVGQINPTDFPMLMEIADHARSSSTDEDRLVHMKDYVEYLDNGGSLYYLKISDYNTHGMPSGEGSHFEAFMGNGRNNKTYVRTARGGAGGTFGGTFGVGKFAMFAQSNLRTMLVSTLTPEGEHVFRGTCYLSTHTFNGQKYIADGFYDCGNGTITDSAEIPEMFLRKEKPGSDFFILGVTRNNSEDDRQLFDEIRKAVVDNFFLAIERGKLEVEVNGRRINRDNVYAEQVHYFEKPKRNLEKFYKNAPQAYYQTYKGCHELCPTNDVNEYIQVGEKDGRYYHFVGNLPSLKECHLYLMKDANGKGCIQYMRSLNMKVFLGKEIGVPMFGLFLCENVTGNEELGNFEDPAHMSWKRANYKMSKDNKKSGAQIQAILDEITTFVNDCVNHVFHLKEKSFSIRVPGLDVPTSQTDQEKIHKGISESVFTPKVEPLPQKPNREKKRKPEVGTTDEGPVTETDQKTKFTGKRTHESHGPRPRVPGPGNKVNLVRDVNGKNQKYTAHDKNITFIAPAVKDKDGKNFWHHIMITADAPTETVAIRVIPKLTNGADTDLEITKAIDAEGNVLKFDNVSVLNLSLKEGLNKFAVQFNDTLQHALSIEIQLPNDNK